MKALKYLTLCAGLALTACNKREQTKIEDLATGLPTLSEEDKKYLGGFEDNQPIKRRLIYVYLPEAPCYRRFILPKDISDRIIDLASSETSALKLGSAFDNQSLLERNAGAIDNDVEDVKKYVEKKLQKR
ncbi:MAG TPA: hypothetical protein VJC07_03265 [Candidatus Nanoarchaeia archaeon]|nr:hypothetical protein [Candidatus Nanoarchaeia archaeon]